MKRIYIKPGVELIEVKVAPILEASTPNTQWNTGTQGQNDDTPIGGGEPDPNEDAKEFNLWDRWE